MDSDSDSSFSADSVDDLLSRYHQTHPLEDDEDNQGIFDLKHFGEDDEEDSDDDDAEEAEGAIEFDEDGAVDDEFDQVSPLDKFEIQAQKEEMASDVEDEEADEEDGLPDATVWGSQKKDYYDTDYVDANKRRFDQEAVDEAKAEEEEALEIQKRLMKEMDHVDLGLTEKAEEESDVLEGEEDEEKESKIQVNVDGLSEREKHQLLTRLHPELIPLIEDLKECRQANEKIEPLIKFANTTSGQKLVNDPAYHAINLVYKLRKRYIVNLAVYLALKGDGEDIRKHAISSRLLSYKKLVKEAEDALKKHRLDKCALKLASRLSQGQELQVASCSVSSGASSSQSRLAGELHFDRQLSERVDCEKNRLLKSSACGPGSGSQGDRRNITYEMAKNKGLTSQKRKELRNPRVKHRMKYDRAKKRRKGQVREPRKELTKYSGEATGIKSGLIRSIKFK